MLLTGKEKEGNAILTNSRNKESNFKPRIEGRGSVKDV